MEVFKNKYYHIHHSNKWDSEWKIGNSIVFDKNRKNEFNEFYENSSFLFRIFQDECYPITATAQMLKYADKMSLQDFKNFLLHNHNVLKDCGMYIREQIFESTRKTINENLPSRINCIWLIEKENLEFWYNRLGCSGIIFEVEATGIAHYCDQVHLYNEIVEHSKIRKDAENYWNGVVRNEHEIEVLFEGEVLITNEYQSIKEVKLCE